MLRISYSSRFQKSFSNLTSKEKEQFKNKLKIFVEKPFYPSLRTKPIQGTNNLFEFSVNMDIRVIWSYEKEQINLVALLDIGHHDILKRF